jgi:hypothetical protein
MANQKQRIVDAHSDLAVRCIHGLRFADECPDCKAMLLAVEMYPKLREIVDSFGSEYRATLNEMSHGYASR